MNSGSGSNPEQFEKELRDNFPLVSLLVLILLLLVFYYPCLAGQQEYCFSDITYYFQPFCEYIAQSLKQGRLPLWNPLMFCGMSQVAVPSPGLFYPATSLMLFLPFSVGLAAYLFFHQLVAGIGTFLFVRQLKWGNLPAVIAGAAVCLCGYMFCLASNCTLVAGVSWLPLCLYWQRTINNDLSPGNLVRCVLQSLSIFMLVAAGRPEVSVPCLLIVGLDGLFPLLQATGSNESIRPFLLTFCVRIFAIYFGIFIAAPILLPALEWAKVSPRAHGLDKHWVLLWSANWFDWVNIVLGYPMGDICALGPQGNPFRSMVCSRPGAIPFVMSSYIGPAIFMLAVCGLSDRLWKERWWIFCLGLGLALMAAGKFTPFAPTIIGVSPLLSTFRYPVKLIVFPCLIGVLLASRGSLVFLEKRIDSRLFFGFTCFFMLTTVIGFVMICVPDLAYVTTHFPWLRNTIFSMELMQKAQSLFGQSIVVASLLGLVVCGLYAWYLSGKLGVRAVAYLLILATALPMFYFSYRYARNTADAGFFSQPCPTASRIKDLLKNVDRASAKRILVFYFDPLLAPSGLVGAKGLNYDEEYYQYTRQLLLPNSYLNFGLAESGGYEAAETDGYKQLLRDVFAVSSQNYRAKKNIHKSDYPLARFCQLTATRLILTQCYISSKPLRLIPRLDPELFELVQEDRHLNVCIYRVKKNRPRIYFADSLKMLDSWGQFLQSIRDDQDRTFKAIENTYLESGSLAVEHLGGKTTEVEQTKTQDSLVLIKDEAETVEIKTQVTEPKVLVLADHFYPGWEAQVDDKPTPIAKANFFSRAVAVPAGEHLISFLYRPNSFYAGFYIAIVVMLLEAVLLIAVWAKSKRRSKNMLVE